MADKGVNFKIKTDLTLHHWVLAIPPAVTVIPPAATGIQ